jgi:hypothetical protein
LLKYAAGDIAATEAKKQAIKNGKSEGLADLTASFMAIGVKASVDASEGADIRMGRYLPAKAYIGGITLESGVYTIVVKFSGGITKTFTNVKVEAGKLNLLEAVCLN